MAVPLRKALRALLAAATLACVGAAAAAEPKNAGPYVPSPNTVVADMLRLANVGPRDFVIDLGSGDGRIVLTAARVFGASGFGVEIKDELVRLSNEAARREGLAKRARFLKADLFKTDISKATVLTMYLLPATVNALRDKLFNELAPGTRIVSHDYYLEKWDHDKLVQFDLADKVAVTGVTTTLIFLYRVPEKVAGRWQASVPAALGAPSMGLELRQTYTRLAGQATLNGRRVAIEDGRILGDAISFTLAAGERPVKFEGTVRKGKIEGRADGGGAAGPWQATRAAQ